MTAQVQPHRQRDMPAQERIESWRVCCQSSVLHRFDCPDVPRGRGPFLPVGKEP